VIIPGEPGLAEAYADEQPVRRDHWHPAAGETVMDIGAGVGIYTIPALLAGAHVIAVDPDTVATAKLQRVAAANGLTGYQVCSCALFNEPGYQQAMAAAVESGPAFAGPVTWDTLDGLVDRLGLERLDRVKIDVEGAELGLLLSGLRVLEMFHPQLLIEDHTRVYPFVAELNSRAQITTLLAALGYTLQLVPWGPPPRDYLVAT